MAVIGLLFVGSMPLLIWMVSRVLKRLDDLNTKVATQNGRVGKLEVHQEHMAADIKDLRDGE